jgi:uncharacterized protein (TIGR03437 family)
VQVNAATSVQPLIDVSGVPGVVPGEVLTLFGTAMGPPQAATFQLDSQGRVPTTLAGTQVLFDGIPAPLLYVSANQVNAIVPYGDTGQSNGLTAGKTTTIQVAYQDLIGPCSILPNVVASAPGIFTADSSGLDQVAAFNAEDGSVNGPDHQAAPGSVVSFYMTGLGQTSPLLSDGAVATGIANATLPVTVTIGGQPAQVLYAGAAPGIVAGVFQINATVPSGLPNGGDLPLTAQVGGVSAQMGVTVAVAGPALPVPRAPTAGDLRFRGVDAAAHFLVDPNCNDPEDCELNVSQTNVTFSNVVFSSPLMPLNGEWRFEVFDSTSGTPPFSAAFQSDFLTNFQAQINAWISGGPSPVVTSLDFEPAQGQYAWSAISSQAGGFDLKYQSVASADLQTIASQEGAASRVITAVAGPNGSAGQVAVLSYGWQGNTATVYEAMVSAADASTVGDAAMTLAASGYIITAFGGAGDNGFLLVGTRMKGDTTARPLVIPTQPAGVVAQTLLEGYAVVGYAPEGCIFEK